jgi:hypothetical protein
MKAKNLQFFFRLTQLRSAAPYQELPTSVFSNILQCAPDKPQLFLWSKRWNHKFIVTKRYVASHERFEPTCPENVPSTASNPNENKRSGLRAPESETEAIGRTKLDPDKCVGATS